LQTPEDDKIVQWSGHFIEYIKVKVVFYTFLLSLLEPLEIWTSNEFENPWNYDVLYLCITGIFRCKVMGLFAAIFYPCAFVGLLHKFEYSFNAWIWNILISLMPNGQNQFIYTRIQKNIFYLCALIGLLYKFEYPCLCCSISCFSRVWPLGSGNVMNEWMICHTFCLTADHTLHFVSMVTMGGVQCSECHIKRILTLVTA